MTENDFDLHESEHIGRIHFEMNGFAARRLVLTQTQKLAQKWPHDTL